MTIHIPFPIQERMSYITPVSISILIQWEGSSYKSRIIAASMLDIENEVARATKNRCQEFEVFVGY